MTTADSNMELLQAAAEARLRAHAEYSHFKVGAALLTEDGIIVRGCNVENSSFGLTLCAERVAITSAVTEGHLAFQSLAVVTDRQVAPCGACRQVMAEFCEEEFPIFVASADNLGEFKQFSLGELLPERFRL